MIRRHFATKLQVREDGDGNQVATGTAVVFNSLSLDLGGFRERVQPGALDWSLENVPLKLLHAHDSRFVLGSQAANTLDITKTQDGIDFEARMPPTSWARDLYISMERGDVAGCSFGFNIRRGGVEFAEEDGRAVQILTDVEVREISVTAFPAYLETSANVRDVLTGLGINAEQLTEALTAGEQTDESRAIVARTIQALERAGGRADAPPAAEGTGRGLDLLYRRLQLAELA